MHRNFLGIHIDIHVWGQLWSTCPGSNTELELAPPHHSPAPFWQTLGDHSVGVNYFTGWFIDGRHPVAPGLQQSWWHLPLQ